MPGSYPITVGKRKGTHEPPFPKNDAPEENDGTKRRYTQAAPFGPGGPKAVPSTKTATKNEKNRKSSRRTCRQQARKDPKTVLSDKPAMGKPAAAGRSGSATGDSPYENGTDRSVLCPHIGGTGGSRTLVQTRNPRAFYTLILRLILLPQPGRRRPSRSRAYEISRPLIGVATAIPVSMIPRIPHATGRSARRGTRFHGLIGPRN